MRKTIKKLGRPMVSQMSYFSGYCTLTSLLGIGQGARILGYHGISDAPDNVYAVETSLFRDQMEFLAAHFTAISMDDLVYRIQNKQPIPENAVAITFDDGYTDVYENAYPILKRLNIPATIFLPSQFIETSSTQEASSRMAQSDFMTWDQVRELSQNGIDFGSHTVDHVSMTSVPLLEARRQLVESKAKIEAETGKAVTGFAYPYGTVRDHNADTKQLVEETGYRWAVTGLSGVNHHGIDPAVLRRTKIERDDTLSVFKKAMAGALDPWIVVDKMGNLLPGRKMEEVGVRV